tara:strand:- start:613 stop:810 length:198 start_codon:yes stop_codon:yes gene_type:complete
MNPDWVEYRVGDLVADRTRNKVGIIVKGNYWVQDEYLSSEETVVDVMFGTQVSKQYPIRYIEKAK